MGVDHYLWPTDGMLVLRPLTHSDAVEHLLGEDAEWARWLGGGLGGTNTVGRYIARSMEQWAAGGPTFSFGIRTVAGDVLVGTIDAQLDEPSLVAGQANLAYGLYPSWRGRGFATRAVLLAVDFLRRNTKVREAVILTAEHNSASAAVARRAGFRPAGQVDNGPDILDRHILSVR